MTDDEAKAVAEVLTTADGRCHVCALSLAEEMKKVFPDFEWESMVQEAMDAYWNYGDEVTQEPS